MSTWKRSWIKLWVEMVEDPKVAMMDDRLYRRTIEMFLFAGKEGSDDGNLPAVKDMAWTLHRDPAELEDELHNLAAMGILNYLGDGKFQVKNFAKRQAAMTPAERKKAERARKYGHATVTDMSQDKSQEVTQQSRNDSYLISSISESVSNLYKYYESNIGILTPGIADRLKEDEKDYGKDWMIAAMGIASRMGVRNLAYIEGILTRWREDGYSKEQVPATFTEARVKKPMKKLNTVEEKLRSIP